MNPKALLIPVAAFALSATAVSAFNNDMLQKAGLSQEQISAFETAHELRKKGDDDKARDVILRANIDLQALESIRKTMHEHKDAMRTAVGEAVENNDFEAFKKASANLPLADIITTQEDFELFKEAYELKTHGEISKAREILDELGLNIHHGMHHEFPHKL